MAYCFASVCCNVHVFENWFQRCSSFTLNFLDASFPRITRTSQKLICMPILVECYWLISVFFDRRVNGHNCQLVCEDEKNCWWIEAVVGWLVIGWDLGRANCSHLWTSAENPDENCGRGGRGGGWGPARPSPPTYSPLQPQRSDREKVRELNRWTWEWIYGKVSMHLKSIFSPMLPGKFRREHIWFIYDLFIYDLFKCAF